MLPQFHQASRCRCSITHTNKLTGPSPEVTFHFLLSTGLQATRPKGTTAPNPKNEGAGNEEGKDLNPLPINQNGSLAGFN